MLPFDPFYVILGCIGGLLPDVIRLTRNRHNSNVPSYLRTTSFWLGLALLVALGGFTAWLLGATHPKEAVIYGYAAPQLISSLAAKSQSAIDRGAMMAGEFKLRLWWTS